jgi:hypothetical protein
MRRFSSTIVLLACLGAVLAGCGVNLPDHTTPDNTTQSSTMQGG